MRECCDNLSSSKESTLRKAQAANASYDALLSYICKLGKNPKVFARLFKTNDRGHFTGFALGNRLQGKEHLKLQVLFLDREIAEVKSTINAKAIRIRQRPFSASAVSIKGYAILIYFNAPKRVKRAAKSYNEWFASNLGRLLHDDRIRSSYAHEFTHVQDFRRMQPAFLLERGKRKQAEKESWIQTGTGKCSKDFKIYINDPLEQNAYFHQAMSDIQVHLGYAKTHEEKIAIIGSSAAKFVHKFMSFYLKKQVRTNLTNKSRKRLMTRAAVCWETLFMAAIGPKNEKV